MYNLPFQLFPFQLFPFQLFPFQLFPFNFQLLPFPFQLPLIPEATHRKTISLNNVGPARTAIGIDQAAVPGSRR